MALNKRDWKGRKFVGIYQKTKVTQDPITKAILKEEPIGAALWIDDESGTETRIATNPKTKEVVTKVGSWFDTIDGIIKSAEIEDSEYGTQLNIVLSDEGEDYNVRASMKTRYGKNLAERLMNCDIGEVVSFSPYNFKSKGDDGKEYDNVGVSVVRNGEKIKSFYRTAEGTLANGYPEKPAGEVSKAEYEIYNAQVVIFLTKQVTGKFGGRVAETPAGEKKEENW